MWYHVGGSSAHQVRRRSEDSRSIGSLPPPSPPSKARLDHPKQNEPNQVEPHDITSHLDDATDLPDRSGVCEFGTAALPNRLFQVAEFCLGGTFASSSILALADFEGRRMEAKLFGIVH